MNRSLVIIPIVHTEADLGELAGQLRQQVGEEAWADKQRAVAGVWAQIEQWAESADASGLQIYQDGLPVTDLQGHPDKSEAIVDELVEQGSLNHKVVRSLMDRGAKIFGTEDPQLLLREYEIAKAAAEAIQQGRQPDPRDAQRSETLLARRDMMIAKRIDETLPDQGRGVLFIGMLHDVESKLPANIEITHPLGKPSSAPSNA